MGIISCFDNVRPVWKEGGYPPYDLATPDGFTVTPSEAHFIANSTGDLPIKWAKDIYADQECYYVYVPSLISNSASAKHYGLKINGQTGEIWDQNTKTWKTTTASRIVRQIHRPKEQD